MRRLLALTICFLLVTADLLAKTHDWQELEALNPGDSIKVTLKDGQNLNGEFRSVNTTILRMAVFTRSGFGSFREIERDKIRKVVKVNNANLPDPHKLLLTGAIIGGVAGGIAGGLNAPSHTPKEPGIFFGALGGGMAGMVGAGVVGIGIGVHRLAHLHTTIYEAK